MIRNPRGMDADRELHGRIYAVSNYKAVIALQLKQERSI